MPEVGGGGVERAWVVEHGDGGAPGSAGDGGGAEVEDALADGSSKGFAVAAELMGEGVHGLALGVGVDGGAEDAEESCVEGDLMADDDAGVVFAVELEGVFGEEQGLPRVDADVGGSDGDAPRAGRVLERGQVAAGESSGPRGLRIVGPVERGGDAVPGVEEGVVEVVHGVGIMYGFRGGDFGAEGGTAEVENEEKLFLCGVGL